MNTRVRRVVVGASSLAVALIGFGHASAVRAQAPPPPPVPVVTETPSPLPSASQTPAPQATGSPTPASTGAASPAPRGSSLARPIRLERSRVGIVPGGRLGLVVSGGVGALVARSSSPSVDAAYDAGAHRLTLSARTAGTASVSVADGFGDSANVDVLVAPPAGFVPAEVTVMLGGNVSPAYATARANEEIARQAQLQPKVAIDVHGIVLANTLHAGDRIDVSARVKIDGANVFVDALGTTVVHLRDELYPKLDPQVLLYSDDPERLGAADDGVLFHADVAAQRPARAYVYHVSDTPGRKLYLALASPSGSARVQLLGYSAGPENAYSFVGHRSTLQYLLERGAQESVILDVAEGVPFLVPLGGRAMRAGDLVASIYDVRALQGGALSLSVVAVTGDRDPIEVLGEPARLGDGHGRRGEFSLVDVPPLALTYAIGGAEPTPFSIGTPTLANVLPGGRALGGDYGVLRAVALQVSNPTTSPATAYFYESPAGGNATTTMWFAGDPAPLEVPCVKIATSRYAIKAFDLAPGETRAVSAEYMTDGTSYFPLLFGLTGTPPSPPPGPYSPDACTPKVPPANLAPTPVVPIPSPAPAVPAAPATAPTPTPPPAT